jgi:hypothetical protein
MDGSKPPQPYSLDLRGATGVQVGHNPTLHIHYPNRGFYRLEVLTSRQTNDNKVDPYREGSPSYLLDAYRQIVPFRGRDNELSDITNWRDSSRQRSLLLVSGPAGQGKTRLAMEFAHLSRAAGWIVLGAAEADGSQSTATVESVQFELGGAPGALLIVDYADRWQFAALITVVRDMEYRFADSRLRIILLARGQHGLWDSVSGELDRGAIELANPLRLGLLDEPDCRAESFQQAFEGFQAALKVPANSVDPPSDLADPAYGNPLMLHMAALVRVYAATEHTLVPSRDNLSRFLLRRERRYWGRICRRYASDGRHDAVPIDVASNAVLLATLFGPLPSDSARKLLLAACLADGEARARAILVLHAALYPNQTRNSALEPLRPDRLGEDFVAGFLLYDDDTGTWHNLKRVVADLSSDSRAVADLPPSALRRLVVVLSAASANDRHPELRDLLFELLLEVPELAKSVDSEALHFIAGNAPLDVLDSIDRNLPLTAPELVRAKADLRNDCCTK